MDREKFIRASITTRVYEKNLLTSENLKRIIDTDNLEEALSSLNDTKYGELIQKLERAEDYEKILSQMLLDSYKAMIKVSPDENLVHYLEEKYNFHNLKTLVKELIQDDDYSSIYIDIGKIDLVKIKRNLKEDLTDNDKYLSYAKKALDLYKENKDPQDIDLSLDKDFYEKLLEDSENLDYESLINFTKERIDLTNLKTLLRIKGQGQSVDLLEKALIDGGNIDKNLFRDSLNADKNSYSNLFFKEKIYPQVKKSMEENDLNKAMQKLEKVIDNHLMDFAKESKKVSYGPEVIMGYLISREMEIKNLRIILTAKLNSLSREFMEERLRDLYV
ncbi:V-type ATP synthase subunit C [Anaerococcus hydrogenalis]|uniref:ATP synthase, subunit C n=2 Tax=Anaerococcus hydrogenalis TaxID=33029 RepID=F0H184_9FIRM|nr:V-type ATP synthase subunit C [Anaerococcus hydrogenalis]EGC83789.1 ATP synthase, subunit C [Anaerococcus hydrogenalis ACS-025-V-Sch4]MDK7695508.1 V-type ATP synthase subunit C [Anaerococcus hydrogenalis]MDK7697262.1 V-type ATP synthase subunit C [Anaerococcus hydrogenalis]MDK7708535.1 V-type ATP synthase subunit C [Anaerococcus hydrogenalis]PMC81032.1 V-type ATP synthase subunit C [Anaerococcus hydrogenalis]